MKHRRLLTLIALMMSLILTLGMCSLADETAEIQGEVTREVPAAAETVTEETAVEENAPEEPVTEETATEETVAEETATEEPATEETATEEHVTEETATEETATEEHVTEETATEETVAEETVTEEPATEETATEETVAEETATEETETEAPVTTEETALRAKPDGMSEVIAVLPEGTAYTILSREGDWCLVQAGDACGYLFSAEAENIEARVTIFTSRTPNLALGQEIVLTSELTGVPEETEVRYQWQYDRGFGFENVPDANEAYYTFEASMDTLSYTWRLKVTLVDPAPAENAEG